MKNLTQNHTLAALAVTVSGSIIAGLSPAIHHYVGAFAAAHPVAAQILGLALAGVLAALPGVNHQAPASFESASEKPTNG